jgi:hypothetical protein
MIERQRKEKEENEEKERNKEEKEGQLNWTIEAGESDDLPQFNRDIASMRKDRKQRRSHKKNRVAGKCGSGKKPVLN